MLCMPKWVDAVDVVAVAVAVAKTAAKVEVGCAFYVHFLPGTRRMNFGG